MMYKELFKESCIFYKLANNKFASEELKEFFMTEVDMPGLTYNLVELDDTVNILFACDLNSNKVFFNYIKFFEVYLSLIISCFIKTGDISVFEEISNSNLNLNACKNKLILLLHNIKNISNRTFSFIEKFKYGSDIPILNIKSYLVFEDFIEDLFEMIDVTIILFNTLRLYKNANNYKNYKNIMKLWLSDFRKKFKDFTNDPMNDSTINSDVTEYLNQQGEYEVDAETGETLDPKILNEYGKEFIKNPNLNDVYEGKFGQ